MFLGSLPPPDGCSLAFIRIRLCPKKLGISGINRIIAFSVVQHCSLLSTARSLLADGADPLTDIVEKGAKNPKHVEQWRMTLKEYAKPIRSKMLDQITTEDVLAVLRPICVV